MMACRLCAIAVSPFLAPADRRCGFDEQGRFRPSNFRCGTLHALQIAGFFFGSSQLPDGTSGKLACVPGPEGKFVLLAWVDEATCVRDARTLRVSSDGSLSSEEPLSLDFAEVALMAKH